MPHRLFQNLSTDDVFGGVGTGTFVALKLLFFSEATYHFTLVSFDAFLGGAIGLVVVHYGKKVLKSFDEWVAIKFKKEKE